MTYMDCNHAESYQTALHCTDPVNNEPFKEVEV